MSKKIIFVGDLHFKSKNLKDLSSAWLRLVEGAASNGVPLILQAGDVFHHSNVYGREASTGTIYDAFLSPFRQVEKAPKLLISIGNHDMGGPSDKDALAPVDKYDWIRVVRNPGVVEPLDDLFVFVLPWMSRSHLLCSGILKGLRQDEILADIESKLLAVLNKGKELISKAKADGKMTVVLGHVEVEGAALGHGMTLPGGGFPFTPSQLVSLSADIYSLGHVHIRQRLPGLPGPNDGYLGTLCQNSFKEVGNDVGCRLVEYDGRKIICDRMVENLSSPRYYNISSLEDRKWRDIDYVKYRSTEQPDNLPPNVIFEPLPKQPQVRSRGRGLSEDDSLETLLQAWSEASKVEGNAKDWAALAEELSNSSVSPADSIGSLERIDRISLVDFVCHSKTELDLSSLSGLCAVEGPNGSGKTSAMEALVFCLFGTCPTRPRLDMLTTKGKSGCQLELDFVSSGERLRVRREVKVSPKSSSQKAILVNLSTNEPEASGPDNVSSFSERAVGNPQLVLSGVFSSQNESGNLIDLKPAERKALFAKLLGTEKFLHLSASAKKAADALLLSVDAKNTRKKILSSALESEDDEKSKKELAERKLAELKEERKSLEKLRQQAASKKSELDALSAERGVQQKALAKLQSERTRLVEEGRKIKALANSVDEESIEHYRKKKHDMDLLWTEYQSSLSALAKANDAHAEKLHVSQKAESEAGKIAAEVSEEHVKYLNKFEAELSDLKQRISVAESKRKDEVSRTESELRLKEKDLEHAEKSAALLIGFPDMKECASCPLAKDGVRNRQRIEGLKDEKKTLGQALAEAREKLNQLLVKAKEKVQEIEGSKKTVAERQPEVEAARQRAKELFEEASSLNPVDLKQKVANLQEQTKDKGNIDHEYESLLESQNKLAQWNLDLDRLRKDVQRVDAEMKSISEEMPPDQNSAHKECVQLIADLEKKETDLSSEVETCLIETGRAKQALESFSGMKTELESLEKESKADSERMSDYQILAKAFGRDGVPQMIFEEAIPHFQSLLADMMQEFDNNWAIQVVSQKETKSGSIQEHIDILVDDGLGEREISGYSGGERKLLKNMVRVAFSVMQAQRSGKGLKVLVLDEATDAMDEAHAEAFVRVLHKLKDFFNQIFVVSHNDRMLSSIPSRIRFEKKGATTTSMVVVSPS